MPRAKKDSQALNMNLEKGLHNRLLAYCKLSGLTKTFLFLLFDNYIIQVNPRSYKVEVITYCLKER